MKRVAIAVFFCAAASGCASTAKQPSTSLDDLYDGRSEVAFGTLMPVGSAEEAVARGDKARLEDKNDLALFEYVRALEKDTKNSKALFKIGEIHQERGNGARAAQAYRLLLEHEPEHAAALENLGLLMLEDRRYSQAKTYLERASKADPSRWRVHNGLGIIADMKGQHQEARRAYQAGLHVQPHSPKLLNNLGYSEYLRGNHKAAIKLYRRALAEAPNYERAWNNLGLLYATEGRYQDAVDAMTHVMSEAEAHNSVGFVCLSEKNYDCAERMFRAAMRRSPHFYVAAKRNLKRVETLRKHARRNQPASLRQ